jgi:hypothetical protein
VLSIFTSMYAHICTVRCHCVCRRQLTATSSCHWQCLAFDAYNYHANHMGLHAVLPIEPIFTGACLNLIHSGLSYMYILRNRCTWHAENQECMPCWWTQVQLKSLLQLECPFCEALYCCLCLVSCNLH